jgi:hypothetical protein
MIDAEVEIVPPGAGKPRADFIIEADFVIPSERGLHRWPQDVVALFVGNPAARVDAHHVVRQLIDKLDHPMVPAFSSTQPGRPVGTGRRIAAIRGWIRT